MSRRRRERKYDLTRVRLDPDRIRAWRLDKQLNQIRAAKYCGICAVTYRRLEHGNPVQALTAARVAKKIGSTLSELRLN